ncbi:EAL domain-containing protein [Neptunomonas sp.]|uniref:bifunctional diguanylate cyclase/phosphodiesterase n=1 Tax=Neptunomonas sp. TaxID=1971898 RepID=UPI0025E74C30|nr:EAL domain-containing protein [Neptunomonas sp.]
MHTPEASELHLQESTKTHNTIVELMQNRLLWNTDLESALKIITIRCAIALNVNRTSVWYMVNNQYLECQILYDKLQKKTYKGQHLLFQKNPAYFEAIEANQILDAHDAQKDPRTKAFADSYLIPLNIHSILDASFRHEGHTEGVVCFEHTGSARIWSFEEQTFAVSVSGLVSNLRIFYALKDSETRYRLLYDQCGDGVLIIHNNQIMDCNQTAVNIFGNSKADIIGRTIDHLSPKYQPDGSDSSQASKAYINKALQGQEQSFEWLHLRLNDKPFYTDNKLNRLEINGHPHLICTIHDINAHKIATKQIIELNSLQKAIFDGAKYSIISTDTNGTIQTFNKAAEEMLGYTAQEMIGKESPALIHKESEVIDRSKELAELLGLPSISGFDVFITLCKEMRSEEREWTYIHKCGKEIPVLLSVTALHSNHNEITGYLGIAYDITQRKQAEEDLKSSQKELEYQAHHDSLTGLPNRAQLHTTTKQELHKASENNQSLALMLLDLDRFKEVNDTLGHHIGDRLLQKLAIKLNNAALQYKALPFRLGGDEFAILLSGLTSHNHAYVLAEFINDSIKQPFEIDDVTLELGASIGIALYPEHGSNSHDLLRCADIAMYNAKSQSSGVSIYNLEQDSHSPRRLQLMAELGVAIRDAQLILYYQPKIELKNQKCIGFEALIRWEHPVLGMIPPSEFIHLAEMSNAIHSLSLWVITHAIQQLKKWQGLGIYLPIAINLSARNLINQSLPDIIKNLLKEYDVAAKWLEVEITESAFISDPERAESVTREISKLGIALSIDDFGTGYSSLSYLKRLPIQTLKVDRSFVDGMLSSKQDAAIVHSTIGLAHSFGLTVVAEGVENKETLDAITQLNCEHAQGYFICKPAPEKQILAWYYSQLST